MTFEQLYAFYAIYENQTFSKAADELHMTQSALSKQIAKLEQELETCLFDRTHRQISLTVEGKQFLKDTQIILENYEQMMNHLQVFKETKQTTIKIAMFPIFAQYDLAKKINEFSKHNPHIHLTIDEIEERDISHHFNHHYDVYILRGNYEELSAFSKLTLYDDNLVCILPKDHRLAQKNKIDLIDLMHEDILLPPAYTMISHIAIEACHSAGFNPHILRHGRSETLLSAVHQGEGIALMMKKTLHVFYLSNVKIIPLLQDIHGDIILYYDAHNPTIEAFVQHMKPHQ